MIQVWSWVSSRINPNAAAKDYGFTLGALALIRACIFNRSKKQQARMEHSVEIESEKWRDVVMDGALELGVSVSSNQARLLQRHAVELMQWNHSVNLTAITDPEEVAVKHCVDALAPCPLIGESVRILDAGSGGGFPGIPVKIMRSDVSMTLIDSVRKKVSFLKHAIRTLGLKEIHAVHGRLEDLGRSPQYRGKYDLVICRAFSSLEKFVSLAIPFLGNGGRLLALKGPQAEHGHEMPKLEDDGTVFFGNTVFYTRTVPYTLPYLDAKRSLVWLIPKIG